MSVSPQFLDELRSRVTLSEIVGRKVRLIRAGREYKACCPFHNEKTPSFTLNDQKGFYHCFGCGAHGDVVRFMMDHDNLPFMEAVTFLAGIAGLEVPRESPEVRKKDEAKKTLSRMMEEAAAWFSEQLFRPGNAEVLGYLEGRGLTRATMATFGIGYAPFDGQELRRHLVKAGYSDRDMMRGGLLREGTRGDPYAFFRERVMFPVHDLRGRVVAFGGRILPVSLRPASSSGHEPPKYLNSPDTELFSKGTLLYGAHLARSEVQERSPPVVVEGYMDVIACHQAGIRTAVAPLGTALTEEQIIALWRMIPHDHRVPILCLDGDEAGRRAAARACQRALPMLKPDHSLRLAFLPSGEDPDSLLGKQGKEALDKVLDAAMSLSDFLWMTASRGRGSETPEARAGISHALESEALKIADRAVQAHYRRVFRDRISETFFSSPAKGRKPLARSSVAIARPEVRSAGLLREKILLAAILNHPGVYHEFEEAFGVFPFTDPGHRKVQGLIQVVLSENPECRSGELLQRFEERGMSGELRAVLCDGVYTHAGFALPTADFQKVREGVFDILKTIRAQDLHSERKRAGQEYRQDPTEENEKRLILLHEMNKMAES